MSNDKQGFFWHVHHEKLMEWCHSYDERAEYIRTEKPLNERETRLRLFQPVKGNLPEEVTEACRAFLEAKRVYVEAGRVYVEAGQARDEAWRAYNEASQAYYEATQDYDEALSKNMFDIEALHAEECPNCPWNGHTILPNA